MKKEDKANTTLCVFIKEMDAVLLAIKIVELIRLRNLLIVIFDFQKCQIFGSVNRIVSATVSFM